MNDPTSYPTVLTSLLASMFALAVLSTTPRPVRASTTPRPYKASKGPKMTTSTSSPLGSSSPYSDPETLTTLEREEELASLAFRDDRELAELEALGSAKRADPYTTGEADSGVPA